MRNMKKWAALLCAATLMLTGCGSNGSGSTSATTQTVETTVAAETTTVSETAYPLTVAGTDGDEVVLEAEPERVISVGPNITELIYSLEAEDKLVGRTDYCDYPEAVLSVDTIGTLRKPDIEKMVSLEPDLVIASTHFEEESKEALKKAGIQVLVLYEKTDVSGVYTMIDALGLALNREEQAAAVVEDMQTRIAAVEEAVKDAEPVSVYYVVGYGEGGEYTAGGDTFIHGILTAAGGKNVAEEVSGWSYSVESLLEADPEVVILSEADYEGFTTTAPYTELSAVQNGKVYRIDTNMLDRQCARNADAIEEVAKLLHPEVFETK